MTLLYNQFVSHIQFDTTGLSFSIQVCLDFYSFDFPTLSCFLQRKRQSHVHRSGTEWEPFYLPVEMKVVELLVG